MNRIAYLLGRATLVLGALATLAPISHRLFNMTWN
jgi:hypothetical protein